MSADAVLTLVVVAAMVVCLALDLLPPDVVTFSALGTLLLAGVVDPSEALAGFSNSAMITVAVLFIVAYAAQSAGVLEYVAAKVMGDGRGMRRALARMIVSVTSFSAFLNNTPIVAMFLPAVRDWTHRKGFPPSKFLIPLSYASILGGLCTLIGTSTNLLINGMYQETVGRSLSMFELAWVGVPSALLAIAYLLIVGPRLVPDRSDPEESLFGAGREYLFEMRLTPGSPLRGKTVEAAGLRRLGSVFLAEILRGPVSIAPVKPTDVLEEGDRLIFAGAAEGAVVLHRIPGLVPSGGHDLYHEIRRRGEGKVLEAVVSRSSPLLGKTIKQGNFRGRYDAVVLAVHRHGERVRGKLGALKLRPGDTLLLLSGPDFLKRWGRSREFYLVSTVSEMPRLDRRKTWLAAVALGGMVLLSASGILSVLKAAVLAAVFLIVTRCVTAVEARRSLEINVLVVIASSLGIGYALEKSGAAASIASIVLQAVQGLGPRALLAAVFVFASGLTGFITNNAAAALAFPVALSAAKGAGLDPHPFVIAVAVAASASFASPVAYQTNMMVYGPGGYRFTDFVRVGLPLHLLYLVVSVLLIPMIWSF